MDIYEIARQLSYVRWQGDTFMARCPAHEDQTPSLSGKSGDDGRTLLKCHAGCKTEDVLSEIDLSFRDLYPTPLTATTPTLRSSPSTPTTYDYCDVDATFLTQIVRGADKSFYAQSKPDGEHWIQKAANKRVPYRLPDLVDQSTVWIVEGEKDVNRCWDFGIPATCNMFGAGKWKAADTQALVDLKTVTQVYVVPDNDKPGLDHATAVAAELQRVKIPVTIVSLPNPGQKGDISDWFNAGGTVKQLEALAATPTPLPAAPTGRFHLTRASDITPKPVDWLWDGRLPLGAISLLAGREGLGKSLLAYTLAAQLTRGETPGHFLNTPKSVIVVATEDSWEHTIVPRLLAAGANCDRVFQVTPPPTFPNDVAALDRLIDDEDAALIILDPLLSRLDGKLDSHVNAKVRQGLEPLGLWVETRHVAILGLMHPNKNTTGDLLTSLTGSRAFAEVARAVLMLIADPDDPTRRLLGQAKNNLGLADQPTLAFTIVSASIEEDITTAKIMWLPDDPRSPNEIWEQANAPSRTSTGSSTTNISDASTWLRKYLTERGGTAETPDILKAGALLDYSKVCCYKAKKRVCTTRQKRGQWSLPPAASTDVSHRPPDTSDTNDTNDTSLAGVPPPNSAAAQTEDTEEVVSGRGL